MPLIEDSSQVSKVIVTCPRCNYQRQDSDRCPDYECPKCGIVYAKFIAAEAKRAGQTQPSAKSSAKHGLNMAGSIESPVEVPQKKRMEWLSNFKMPASGLKFFAFVAVCTVAVCTIAVVLAVNFTDYGNLRYHYWRYTTANEDIQFDKSYQYLTSATRQRLSLPEWLSKWESSTDMRHTEVYKSVTFSGDGRSARVLSVIEFEGKRSGLNYQTWVKEDEAWFRGYVNDNPEAVKEMRRNFNKKQNARSRPKLHSLITSWGVDSHDVFKVLLTPKTAIVLTNDGDVPITNLRVKVSYYDKSEQVVMSDSETNVVDDRDDPLLPGANSKNLFLNSNVGFSIAVNNASAMTVEKINDRIERRIFFRHQSGDEWVPMSTTHLVLK